LLHGLRAISLAATVVRALMQIKGSKPLPLAAGEVAERQRRG